MNAWTIVPKGDGDLAARVGMKPDGKQALEMTLFAHPEHAKLALKKLPKAQQVGAEVVQVEITLR